MKVDIKRGESTTKVGMFKKIPVHTVSLDVAFTEEEKKAIEMLDIGGHVLIERRPPPGVNASGIEDVFHLHVRHLLKNEPNVHEFERLDDANSYANEIPDALRTLKSYLEENMNVPGDSSFEI